MSSGSIEGPTDATVERRQVAPDLFKIDKSVDRPQQMVGGNMLLEREFVEQRSLLDLPMPHHNLHLLGLNAPATF
jgi:hypothetical protein